MKSHLIASRLSLSLSLSLSARVDAFFASGGFAIGGALSTHSADLTAAAMNRAAGLSDEDIARYGVERDVRRALGVDLRIATHAVSLIEDLVSGPCAKCLDAVSGLGLPPHELPSFAELYEILFEMRDGAAKVFPTAPVLGPLGVEKLLATEALEKVLGVMQSKRATTPDRFGISSYSGGLAGFAHEELDHLLDQAFQARYFVPDSVISRLGPPLEIETGDLVRISIFVAFARKAGVQTTAGIDRVRELAVNALRD